MLPTFRRCLVAAVLTVLPVLAQVQPLLPDGVQSTGPLRNNYTGYVGMEFTPGLSLQATSLGRAYFSGNNGTHTIKVVNAVTLADIPGASVQLTMNANGATPFQYAALPAPVVLQANTKYLLVSQEIAGGDTWQDLQNITPSVGYNYFSINGGVYTDAASAYVVVPNTAGGAYVPPNMLLGFPTSSGTTTITITSPAASQTLTAPYVYQFTAAVSGGNAQTPGSSVQFQLDGESYYTPQPFNSSASYSIPVDPITLTAGTHSITAVFTAPSSSAVTSVAIPFSVQQDRGTYVIYPLGTLNLVTGQTLGSLRNNFTGFVGMSFTTGKDPLRVRSLGRFVAPGDSQSHVVKLVDAATGVDVPGASANVALSSLTPAGQFSYTYLPPNVVVVLQPSHAYYLLSQETAGADPWYDIGPVLTSGLAVNGPVYQSSASTYQMVPDAGYSYVPVSLEYSDTLAEVPPLVTLVSPAMNSTLSGTATVQAGAVTYQGVTPSPTIVNYQFQISMFPGSPVTIASGASSSLTFDTTGFPNGQVVIYITATDSEGGVGDNNFDFFIQNTVTTPTGAPFVTSVQPTFTRNNYGGNVGMRFTVGAAPLQVTALGRYCVAGNSQSHTVALTGPLTATATVNMLGCTPGQYAYSTLATPISLAASSTYYLYDTEVVGGDLWYDYSPIGTTTAASVTGPVYSDSSGTLVTVPSPSSSYVPLNFRYTAGPAVSDNLTTSITGITSQGVAATATSNSTITSVQIQVDGYSLTPPLTTAPYVQALPQLNIGTHQLTSVATDSAGNSATSAPFADVLSLPDPQQPGEYQAPSLVNFALGPLRNNYTGWVGFQFTMSAVPVYNSTSGIYTSAPSFMGRTCVPGNTQTHFIKIVKASDGTDVASAWINCGGVAAGTQQSYASVVGSIVPGATYYLVSQETAGGDQFADIGTAVPISCCGGSGGYTSDPVIFTIDGPVYFDGAKYVLVPQPNYSYAGLYLLGLISAI